MHVHFLGEQDDGLSISSHHARALAGLGVEVSFSEKKEDAATAAARDADIIHVVPRGALPPALLREVLRLRGLGKPVVRIWSGEDLLWACWHAPSQAAALMLCRIGVHQVCRTAVEAERLAAIGLEVTVLRAVSTNVSIRSEPQPLPQHFTLLCYLPHGKHEYYGGDLLDSLAKWLPAVRFLVLGDVRPTGESKNVEYLGFVEDIGRSIQRATAVIHARRDQTLSRIVLEALSHGRHVLCGCDFPYTIAVRSIDEHLGAIRVLQRDPTFNLAGREEIGRHYDQRITAEALRSALAAMTDRQDWSRGVRGGWLRATNMMRMPPAGELSSPPDLASLPPEADAFKALLRGERAPATIDSSPAVIA